MAAGMCAAATGSDTGGSIRNPTAWCGVSGLKPTFGAIDPKGIVPLAWSLDTVGFLAHTVLDCAQLFAEVADSMQERPPSERRSFVQHVKSQPTRRPRVLVARNVIELSEPEVRGSFHDAVEALNGVAQVEEIDLPRLDDSLLALMTIIISEGAAAWEAALRAGWDRFGPPVRALLDVGRAIRATEYLHAQRIREGIRREMLQLFEPHDALFMPTMGIAPRPNVFENADVVLDSPMWHLEGKFTGMWSLTGFPVLSIPCAFTDARRPIAMQIVGAPWSEVSLLQVGMIAEAAWSIPRLSLEPTWVRSQVSGDAAA